MLCSGVKCKLNKRTEGAEINSDVRYSPQSEFPCTDKGHFSERTFSEKF